MLRNRCCRPVPIPCSFLNEVLSLNAQEFLFSSCAASAFAILNEVLSLNAQEYIGPSAQIDFVDSPQ